jgi:putative selenium metabolism protein SsnA
MLIKNAHILTLAPARIERADLRIENGEVASRRGRLQPRRGEETIDVSGKFIIPGFVNAHTHLYSSLARGMAPPIQPPRNFVEILKRIWWELDESLDEESIYYSALVGAVEAARYGTTMIFDHHSSPRCISRSLDIIKEAIAKVGLRAVLCYETTDRSGRKRRELALAENERFVTENTGNSHFRGTVGAHASFTLDDETLGSLGDLAHLYDCGVHIHVAEDLADVNDAREKRRIDIIRRLEKFGILSEKSILAHGVHLTQQQLGRVQESGAWLAHNPRSNMNNAVGYAPLRWFGKNTALGTDGFPADMFEEAKLGFFRNAESNHKVALGRIPEILQAGQRLAASFFGRDFGSLTVGSPADLIVFDYNPPTPLQKSNLLGHFLFGMNSSTVESVMVDGEWVVWNRQLVRVKGEEVMTKAVKIAEKLWKRMK